MGGDLAVGDPGLGANITAGRPSLADAEEALRLAQVEPERARTFASAIVSGLDCDDEITEVGAVAERALGLAARELDDLMRDAGDGAGNDQADVGSTTFERDHEMSLANNARLMLMQTEHALERIVDGTYGVCESCGQPIGKMRLMAFPRATLCLSCKQREERR